MATGAATPQAALPATETRSDLVIGISPFLQKAVKDEVYRAIVRLLVEQLPLNSSVSIYDAFNLKTITRVTLPNAPAFNSPKTRANQFAGAVRELKQFLAKDNPNPANKGLEFDGAIRLPQFCDFIEDNAPGRGQPCSILLIGSPLYQDAKEPAFSMVDGYFPSDGHLTATREQSVFGIRKVIQNSLPWLVHWVYFGDPWMSDLHKEKVTRFWSLYFSMRAGRLATFCGDLPTAMRAFCQRPTGFATNLNRWALDPQQSKIEMLRITRKVDAADWLTRDGSLENASSPPETFIGPMKIGIRWKQAIDLDLYATARPGAETLFFQHTRSPEGYYYKDHRSSPGREYEFIEFEAPVDCRKVEAFVNFYKGSCPGGPNGEVRIEFAGRIYSGSFVISATEGNGGRTGKSQEGFWTRIPVQGILKIAPSTAALKSKALVF